MNILAIDPGSTESAYVIYTGGVMAHDTVTNEEMLSIISIPKSPFAPTLLVIEDMQSFGMPVGREVFDAVRWTGRFDTTWAGKFAYITRKEVVQHLCGSPRGNDATIRQALIDRWGGSQAIKGPVKCSVCKGKGWSGTRKKPIPCDRNVVRTGDYSVCFEKAAGPLHGIKGDEWSALALSVAYADLYLK